MSEKILFQAIDYVCQFLIGKVKHVDGVMFATKPDMCQFLIGKVKRGKKEIKIMAKGVNSS